MDKVPWQLEIEELEKAILFLKDFVDVPTFELYAEGVRSDNHDIQWELGDSTDNSETLYNLILNIWRD